jgi:hypothetical protein
MRAIKKLSRWIASALFTAALSDTFDWVQSVPTGERPRVLPPAIAKVGQPAPAMKAWNRTDGLKPSTG